MLPHHGIDFVPVLTGCEVGPQDEERPTLIEEPLFSPRG